MADTFASTPICYDAKESGCTIDDTILQRADCQLSTTQIEKSWGCAFLVGYWAKLNFHGLAESPHSYLQKGLAKSVVGNPATDFCNVLQRDLQDRFRKSVKVGFGGQNVDCFSWTKRP